TAGAHPETVETTPPSVVSSGSSARAGSARSLSPMLGRRLIGWLSGPMNRDGMPGSSGRSAVERGPRETAVRCVVPTLLILAYALAFRPLHGTVGSPAFLLGLLPCLAAAALLGLRGAIIAVLVVAAIDRSFALTYPAPDTSPLAGAVALLTKLLFAGGLGAVLDVRRRERELNAQLRHEIEERQLSQESLRRSESLHRALVQSLGEGVGLFDADDRVVFANEALATLLGTSSEDLVG